MTTVSDSWSNRGTITIKSIDVGQSMFCDIPGSLFLQCQPGRACLNISQSYPGCSPQLQAVSIQPDVCTICGYVTVARVAMLPKILFTLPLLLQLKNVEPMHLGGSVEQQDLWHLHQRNQLKYSRELTWVTHLSSICKFLVLIHWPLSQCLRDGFLNVEWFQIVCQKLHHDFRLQLPVEDNLLIDVKIFFLED